MDNYKCKPKESHLKLDNPSHCFTMRIPQDNVFIFSDAVFKVVDGKARFGFAFGFNG